MLYLSQLAPEPDASAGAGTAKGGA